MFTTERASHFEVLPSQIHGDAANHGIMTSWFLCRKFFVACALSHEQRSYGHLHTFENETQDTENTRPTGL